MRIDLDSYVWDVYFVGNVQSSQRDFYDPGVRIPGTEVPGYYRLSLRDAKH